MDDITKTAQEQPTWLELESVKPLTVTRGITNLSPATQKRQYPEYIVWLSERRCGMKLRHALDIAAGRIQPKSLRTTHASAKQDLENKESPARRQQGQASFVPSRHDQERNDEQ
jgi:hypothetical protein